MPAVIFAANQSSNPIVPATGDLIWSVISFAVLLVLLVKFAFPPLRRMMEQRTEKIRTDIESAEAARNEAESVLAEYRSQLEEARRESSRIIEEARRTADALREEIITVANADANEIRRRAEESLEQERQRVVAEVRDEMGQLAVDLAQRILEVEIERSSTDPLVASFLSEIDSLQ